MPNVPAHAQVPVSLLHAGMEGKVSPCKQNAQFMFPSFLLLLSVNGGAWPCLPYKGVCVCVWGQGVCVCVKGKGKGGRGVSSSSPV